MSFLTGQTKENSPADVQGFRKQLLQFLESEGLGTALHGANQNINLAPYENMFAEKRKLTLAQAKESAGNLTGSGLGNVIGSAAGRSVSEENAFLANLLENARQRSADRFTGLIGQIPSFTGQMAREPGFLDYLFEGASAAAPLIKAL